MRRLVVTLGVVAVCLGFASAAMAKSGCVLTHDYNVICGKLVPPGYRPPPRHVVNPPPRHVVNPPAPHVVHRSHVVVKCRRGYALVRGVCVVSRPRAVHRRTVVCRRGYVLRGRVCVRVRHY